MFGFSTNVVCSASRPDRSLTYGRRQRRRGKHVSKGQMVSSLRGATTRDQSRPDCLYDPVSCRVHHETTGQRLFQQFDRWTLTSADPSSVSSFTVDKRRFLRVRYG